MTLPTAQIEIDPFEKLALIVALEKARHTWACEGKHEILQFWCERMLQKICKAEVHEP